MRPKCQKCQRRPGRRVRCSECKALVGPGCCLAQETPVPLCKDCWQWEPEPPPEVMGGPVQLGLGAVASLGPEGREGALCINCRCLMEGSALEYSRCDRCRGPLCPPCSHWTGGVCDECLGTSHWSVVEQPPHGRGHCFPF